MSKRVEPQDYAWNALYKIRKRPCHEPRAMRSAQSHTDVKAWVCDECGLFVGLAFTYGSSYEAPICYGSSRTIFPAEDE